MLWLTRRWWTRVVACGDVWLVELWKGRPTWGGILRLITWKILMFIVINVARILKPGTVWGSMLVLCFDERYWLESHIFFLRSWSRICVLSLTCFMNNNIVDFVKIVLLLQGISKIQMTCWSFWSEMKKISQHVESASNFPTRQSHVWKIILKQFISPTFLCILALTATRSSIPRSLCTITLGDLVFLNKLNKYL